MQASGVTQVHAQAFGFLCIAEGGQTAQRKSQAVGQRIPPAGISKACQQDPPQLNAAARTSSPTKAALRSSPHHGAGNCALTLTFSTSNASSASIGSQVAPGWTPRCHHRQAAQQPQHDEHYKVPQPRHRAEKRIVDPQFAHDRFRKKLCPQPAGATGRRYYRSC